MLGTEQLDDGSRVLVTASSLRGVTRSRIDRRDTSSGRQDPTQVGDSLVNTSVSQNDTDQINPRRTGTGLTGLESTAGGGFNTLQALDTRYGAQKVEPRTLVYEQVRTEVEQRFVDRGVMRQIDEQADENVDDTTRQPAKEPWEERLEQLREELTEPFREPQQQQPNIDEPSDDEDGNSRDDPRRDQESKGSFDMLDEDTIEAIAKADMIVDRLVSGQER